MKKFKYLLLLVMFLIPGIVNASEKVYYKGYKVGDEITVTLDKEGKIKEKFIVIKKSDAKIEENSSSELDSEIKEDYYSVTAIYVGSVGNSIFTNEYRATSFNDSKAYSNLLKEVEKLGWKNHKDVRLFTRNDLTSMIATLPVKNQNEIYGRDKECTKNSCPILPIGVIDMEDVKKYLPFIFLDNSYWIGEGSFMANADCGDSDYCVTVMVNYANVMSKNGFNKLKASSNALLRPVITIHKSFIDGGVILNCEDCKVEDITCPDNPNISIQTCIENGFTEDECIKQICQDEDTYLENEFMLVETCDEKIILFTAFAITGIILLVIYILIKKIG